MTTYGAWSEIAECWQIFVALNDLRSVVKLKLVEFVYMTIVLLHLRWQADLRYWMLYNLCPVLQWKKHCPKSPGRENANKRWMEKSWKKLLTLFHKLDCQAGTIRAHKGKHAYNHNEHSGAEHWRSHYQQLLNIGQEVLWRNLLQKVLWKNKHTLWTGLGQWRS